MVSAKKENRDDHLLAQAIQLHRAGELGRAITMYETVIRNKPRQAAALNLLSLAYFQLGDADRAVSPLRKALSIDPALPSGHYNLGRIYQALGRHDEARQSYQRALAQQPNDAELCNNLGTVLRALGRHADAAGHFRKAVALQPAYADAYFNLGNACLEIRNNDEASAAFERAAALKPDMAEAHRNGGRALLALRRSEDALVRLDRALALNPGDREARFYRGNALDGLKRYADARGEYEKALTPVPEGIEAHLQNGNALIRLRRFDDAIASYRMVLGAKPDHDEAHYNLAIALHELDRDEEALGHYRSALAAAPGNSQYLWNKGILDLTYGRFKEGWPSLDQRWDALALEKPHFPQPRWDGHHVDGTLLIWGDQGLGDQIIYASMVEDLRRCAKSIRLVVEPRLVGLFARSMPGIDVQATGEANTEGVIAQESLPGIGPHLRADWDSFGRPQAGYLKADGARAAELRARLHSDGKRVIGLAWDSRNSTRTELKSAGLQDFAAVLRLPHCRFVDLQYGDTTAEREQVARALGVEVERLPDVDNFNDIDGLAALISACDLVLTVSNTTAHIAGAVGQKTWVMVPPGNGRLWYWFRERELSPWYARLCLKPKQAGQSWSDLVAQLTPELMQALS